MTACDKFEQIVNNMFKNLSKSLDNLKTDPKASVIFYYSALELLFKARLLHEHWAFILENIDDKKANINNFKSGDFNTVSLDVAAKRIRNIFGDLEADYEKHFDKLRITRNKLIHFDFIDSRDEELSVEAISESWYYIHELLNFKWKKIFKNYETEIDSLNTKFQKYSNHFYDSKQKALIEKDVNKYKNNPKYNIKILDNTILTCKYCNHSYVQDENISLLEITEEDNFVIKKKCDVCGQYEEISIPWMYIENHNILREIEIACLNYLDTYKGSVNIKSVSEHNRLLLNPDKKVNFYIEDIIPNSTEINLEEINANSSKMELYEYLNFNIDSSFNCPAYYYFIIHLELILDKNKETIEKLKFDEIYNSIVDYNISIDVDSDGY